MMVPIALFLTMATTSVADYSPGSHLQFVESRFEAVEQTYDSLDAGEATTDDAAQSTAQLLAAQRQFHIGLSDWIAGGEGVDPGEAMRVLQVSGLFDAYLASRVMQLDGNVDAERDADQIAKILERILE